MNIFGFNCKKCDAHKLEAVLLRKELEEARFEIMRLNKIIKASAPSANKGTLFKVPARAEITTTAYKSSKKSAARNIVEGNFLVSKSNNTEPSYSLTKEKPEPNKISKPLLNKSIKYIVSRNKLSFCKIVQNGTTDWTSGNVSKDDEAQIMALIGKNAHSFLAYHPNELPPEIDRKTFGSLLKTDKRSFAQFVKSELPKVLMEIKKELLQAEKVDLQLAEKKELKRTLWEQHKLEILGVLNEYKPKLLSNLRKSYQIDDYGTIKKDDRNEEIHRFLTSVKLIQKSRKIGLSKVQGYIKTWATNEIKKTSISTPLPENGIDFEYWVADRLREYDWEAQVTQGSGDQGVDVIAGQGNLRIAVQCKLYKGSVGNKAVQETLSGMLFLDLDRGIVISTGKYTRSARELADKNKILLLSPEDIPYVVDLLQK
jgi:restriction system protein